LQLKTRLWKPPNWNWPARSNPISSPLVEQSIANEQLTQEDAASITETVTASKNIISKKLGLVRPLVEAYRDVGKENVEALVRIAYDKEMAEQVSINTIKEELKKKSEDLHQKLDNLLNLSGN
jgi:CHASE3 domain sensor protein